MYKKRIIDPKDSIICRKCLITFPRTLDYFHKNCRDIYGLTRICKTCDNTRRTIKEKEKAYHNHPRHCKTCLSFFYASKANINKSNKKSPHHKNGGSYCSKECIPHPNSGAWGWGMTGKSWNGRRQGSNNPAAILNEEKVKQIRIKLLKGDSILQLANIYGVGKSQISSIKHYHSWKHI